MTDALDHTAERKKTAFRAALTGAVVAGACLRLQQIGAQVVADDEWHALRTIEESGFGRIATHFGAADYSIPIALYDKVVATTTGALDEWWIRAPMLAAGIAAIAILPLFVRAVVGDFAAAFFAWLLAIAPLHVFFSRYARPYVLVMLLVFVAVVALQRWRRGGGARFALLHASSTIAAVWLSLVCAPATVAPYLVALVDGARRRDPRTKRVFLLGVAVACGIALFDGPPLLVDHVALGTKAGRGVLHLDSVSGALGLFAGNGHPGIVVLVVAAIVVGLGALWRKDASLAVTAALIGVLPALALWLTRPVLVDQPIVLARYLSPLLPFALLAVAALVAEVRPPSLRIAVAAAIVVALFATGPLPRTLSRPNNFTNHARFQYVYDDHSRYSYTRRSTPRRMPSFYRELAKAPPSSMTIVEAPWWYGWDANPFSDYQDVHRQRVVIGAVQDPTRPATNGEPMNGAGIALHNEVHIDDVDGLRRVGAKYLVLHKDLGDELKKIALPLHRPPPADAAIARARVRWGTPYFEDDDIVVFDVAGAASPAAAPQGAVSAGAAPPAGP